MKTSELTGAQLDYLVARAEGIPAEQLEISRHSGNVVQRVPRVERGATWCYSTDWAQGGPIIEREHINVTTKSNPDMGGNQWMAIYPRNFASRGAGSTPLVAAMRAFVTRKFGETVEVPHG